MKKTLLLLSLLLSLLFAISACTTAPQSGSVNSSYPNQSYPSQSQTQEQTNSPLTEASVPRITVEDAKLAYEKGEAVIVDVRSAESYAEAHIAGALSIPLTGIEVDPANVPLDKNQWIITYCT